MGFLVANRLAEAGTAVTLSDVGPQRGAYTIEALNSLGGENIRFVNADVKSSNEMEEVI